MPAKPTGCVLLAHLNNSLTDDSGTSKTITKGTGVTYTTTKQLGSHAASFDATANSWLQVADHDDFYFAAGDFWLEGWFRWATLPSSTFQQLIGAYEQSIGGAKSFRWYLNHDGTNYTMKLQTSTSGTTVANTLSSSNLTMTTGVFYHLRFIRVSGTYYFYQDGVQVGTGANSDNLPNVNIELDIGRGRNSSFQFFFNGIADEIMIVKGTCPTTSNFTPPTTEYGASSGGGASIMMDISDL